MSPGFKEWIVKKHEEMEEKAKKDFLRALKFQSDLILRYIKESLYNWGLFAAIDLGKVVCVQDNDKESADVLKAFQEHFKEEMA